MTKKDTKRSKQPASHKDPAPKAPSPAQAAPEAQAPPARPATERKRTAKPRKAGAAAKPKVVKPAGPSGLDVAARVLGSAKEPMRCGDLVKHMLDKGLWRTGGKTPAATINAAIIREIRAKGKESRFKRTGRGLFAATGS